MAWRFAERDVWSAVKEKNEGEMSAAFGGAADRQVESEQDFTKGGVPVAGTPFVMVNDIFKRYGFY